MPPELTLPATTDVRSAFGAMLSAGITSIGLTNADGEVIGSLELETVREIARTHPVEASA